MHVHMINTVPVPVDLASLMVSFKIVLHRLIISSLIATVPLRSPVPKSKTHSASRYESFFFDFRKLQIKFAMGSFLLSL